jgi:lauroyl/myristoyl acyltransferase
MGIDLEKIEYQAISGIFGLLGRVSQETAIQVSNFIGNLWFTVDKRHRNVAISNLTDVFGREKSACTNKGLALIALGTGAPVVPLFLLRETFEKNNLDL